MSEAVAASIRPSQITEGNRRVAMLRAAFDAATTSASDENHWALADDLSADAAASRAVRMELVKKARYEIANNSYAAGIVRTIAEDCIGTGPFLRVTTKNKAFNRRVEQLWREWAESRVIAEKLIVMRMARIGDGEAFGVIAAGPETDRGLTLDLRVIESDRCTTPYPDFDQPVDGIELDIFGGVERYHILRQHPGDRRAIGWDDFVKIEASRVLHWFRATRPEQHRGIPEITPALALFGLLRRYTLATLGAAEAQASLAYILQTDSPPGGDSDAVAPFDVFELERNAVMSMPGGWTVRGLDATQPVTGYGEFKEQIIAEIARCLDLPLNMALGSSRDYNYSSGRLDHLRHQRKQAVDRKSAERVILNPLFAEFFREARVIGEVPSDFFRAPRHEWIWPGFGQVDEVKAATAQKIRLESKMTTRKDEFAREGKDWEAEADQIAEEDARFGPVSPTPPTGEPSATPDGRGDDDEAEDADGTGDTQEGEDE